MLVHDKLSLAISVPDISSTSEKHQQQQQQQQQQLSNLDNGHHQHQIHHHWTVTATPSDANKTTASQSTNNTCPTVLLVEPSSESVSTTNNPSTSDGGGGPPQLPSTISTATGNHGWFNGLLGCLRPVWTILGKTGVNDLKHGLTPGVTGTGDDWDIPFEQISDLDFLGSGAQGAVFKGKLKEQWVAVKKVRDVKETEIKHLRKLNHPNIIKFM
jgi:hypothetical protein